MNQSWADSNASVGDRDPLNAHANQITKIAAKVKLKLKAKFKSRDIVGALVTV